MQTDVKNFATSAKVELQSSDSVSSTTIINVISDSIEEEGKVSLTTQSAQSGSTASVSRHVNHQIGIAVKHITRSFINDDTSVLTDQSCSILESALGIRIDLSGNEQVVISKFLITSELANENRVNNTSTIFCSRCSSGYSAEVVNGSSEICLLNSVRNDISIDGDSRCDVCTVR